MGDGVIAATELEKYAAAMQKKMGLIPASPAADTVSPESVNQAASGETNRLLTPDMRAQLDTVFTRMGRPLILQLFLDERPVSQELETYMTALAAMTDNRCRQSLLSCFCPPDSVFG